MENENVSKNFIEQMIDKDLEEGRTAQCSYQISTGTEWLSAYRTCEIHSFELWSGTEVWRKVQLRFDDTNPTKEKTEFVDAIKEDIKWLGADWEDRLFFASDYFDQMYECAVELIKKGKAYVCDLTAEQIREYRGTLTEPGKEEPVQQQKRRGELKAVRGDEGRKVCGR